MRFFRFLFALLAVLAAMSMTGCAVNRATASLDPSANLAGIKKIHVVQAAEDGRMINDVLAERLNQMGLVATTSKEKRKDVDANMTYVDRWQWDLTMYMIELTIVLRDPTSDFPLATANSFHTSLTRQTPKQMVEETTTNLFAKGKK